MKKVISILLTLCLCISLCACASEDSVQAGSPDNWDRIAQATKTLNQYYACETEEEFRAVIHSSVSDSDLKATMDAWLGLREAWNNGLVSITEQYVRKIKYVESFNGCDVFLVVDGYVSSDGSRTPDNPLPTLRAADFDNLLVATPVTQPTTGHLTALAIENGQYVIANIPNADWQQYYPTIAVCTCDLGVVVIPGDPCENCSGTGCLAVEPDAGTNNENNSTCTTCGGTGTVREQIEAEGTEIVHLTPCPDCTGSLVGAGSQVIFMPICLDCEGTGLKNYSHGDCPDCSGKGYTKID